MSGDDEIFFLLDVLPNGNLLCKERNGLAVCIQFAVHLKQCVVFDNGGIIVNASRGFKFFYGSGETARAESAVVCEPTRFFNAYGGNGVSFGWNTCTNYYYPHTWDVISDGTYPIHFLSDRVDTVFLRRFYSQLDTPSHWFRINVPFVGGGGGGGVIEIDSMLQIVPIDEPSGVPLHLSAVFIGAENAPSTVAKIIKQYDPDIVIYSAEKPQHGDVCTSTLSKYPGRHASGRARACLEHLAVAGGFPPSSLPNAQWIHNNAALVISRLTAEYRIPVLRVHEVITKHNSGIRLSDRILTSEFYRRRYIEPPVRRTQAASTDDDECGDGDDDDNAFSGGLVIRATTQRESNVYALDYRGMYPSLIAEYGICFVQGQPDILPPLMARYTACRDKSPICAPFIKRIANTVYGSIGSRFSRYRNVRVVRQITAQGQTLLRNTRSYFEEQHRWRVVYGDTDSIFVAQARDVPRCVALWNKQFKYANLKIDAHFAHILFFATKRYAAIRYSGDSGKLGDIVCKGGRVAQKATPTIMRNACISIYRAVLTAAAAAAAEGGTKILRAIESEMYAFEACSGYAVSQLLPPPPPPPAAHYDEPVPDADAIAAVIRHKRSVPKINIADWAVPCTITSPLQTYGDSNLIHIRAARKLFAPSECGSFAYAISYSENPIIVERWSDDAHSIDYMYYAGVYLSPLVSELLSVYGYTPERVRAEEKEDGIAVAPAPPSIFYQLALGEFLKQFARLAPPQQQPLPLGAAKEATRVYKKRKFIGDVASLFNLAFAQQQDQNSISAASAEPEPEEPEPEEIDFLV